MSASVSTAQAGKSGPGGGIGGKASQVDRSDISQSSPAPRCSSPNDSTSGRKDGAEATATSCPESESARATGTQRVEMAGGRVNGEQDPHRPSLT
jgi:hypothetical protein